MTRVGVVLVLLVAAATAQALDICLPTANDALLRPGHEAEFFQPTVEGTVESGMFGCVRSHGHKFHEGIDIKCLQHDRRGEPTDPVRAVAGGEVAFFNKKPGLSNYGRYVVLQHRWDGVEVFTLYAHLREITDSLVVGQSVQKGQVIGILGHSTNTREGISTERAHLHFEINFMLNPSFHIWYAKRDPKAPPFGNFNGLNLIGLDPAAVLRAFAADRKLNFAEYLARQPIAFTVLVGPNPPPWLTIHPEQIQASQGTPTSFEIGLTAWGLPVTVWPRSEVSRRPMPCLNRVNEAELERWGCRELVKRSRDGWRLTQEGRDWVELLTYTP